MKPNLLRINQNSSASTSSKSLTQLSEDGGCPSGTVPIKRITKDDLIRHRRIPPPENVPFDDQFVAGNNNISEPNERYMSSQGYKVATARTPSNPSIRFGGGGMITSVYNPHVKGQQHSACRLKIQSESDIIQVGWRVDPILYGDIKTRLFIHFQAGEVHCFNTLCPCFIQVDSEIPLDVSYEDHISQRGGTIWEDTMYIERDLVNGNWWLLLENDYTEVGFWPRKIFTRTGLADFTKSINWGGVAYSPTDVAEPPMGSSFFPIENSGYDAYCKKIAVLDVKGKTIAVDKTITHIDNPNLYNVLFKPLWIGSKSSFYVLYGGPGDSALV
uniref:Neprosin PEP catalytic domain-containing protein n=2 Tax=Solanum tuberosum TaxID=4113 RepID=M1AWD2_SOLTU